MGESEGSEFPPKKLQQSETADFPAKKLARQLDFTQGVLPELQPSPVVVTPASAQCQPQPQPHPQPQPQVVSIPVAPQQQTQQQPAARAVWVKVWYFWKEKKTALWDCICGFYWVNYWILQVFIWKNWCQTNGKFTILWAWLEFLFESFDFGVAKLSSLRIFEGSCHCSSLLFLPLILNFLFIFCRGAVFNFFSKESLLSFLWSRDNGPDVLLRSSSN